MVPESPLEQTEHGLVPRGPGWLILNVRDARWIDRGEGRGVSCSFETFEGDEDSFWKLGINVFIVGAGTRMNMGGPDSNWGAYTVDETAQRHGAGVERDTTDAEVAYARFPKGEPSRYREGWLPD